MSRQTTAVVDSVIDAMESRPGDFSCSEHVLYDKKTLLQYWVGNGASNSGVHQPFEMEFGYREGKRFWLALSWWKAKTIIHRNERAKEAKL